MMLMQFIILQIIVFGAVIYFLKKIFHGDTNSAIQRLGSVHQDLLEQQAELQKKNEEIEKQMQAKKDEAVQLAEKLKLEAAGDIQKKEDAVLKAARAEAEVIISKAQGAREEMEKEIASQISKKMVSFAAELFANVFRSQRAEIIHAELVREFFTKAKSADLSGAANNGDLVVRSPYPLKKEESEKLQAFLTEKIGRPVKASEVLDTDLIAGIALQSGSLVLDGSLANLLREAAEQVQARY